MEVHLDISSPPPKLALFWTDLNSDPLFRIVGTRNLSKVLRSWSSVPAPPSRRNTRSNNSAVGTKKSWIPGVSHLVIMIYCVAA